MNIKEIFKALNQDPPFDRYEPTSRDRLEHALVVLGVNKITYYKTGEVDEYELATWRVRIEDGERQVVGEPDAGRQDALANAAEKYLKARGVI